MHSSVAKRSLETSGDELDAKLELLSQLCIQGRDDPRASDGARLESKSSFMDDQWIQAEYRWVSEAAGDSAVNLSVMLDDEEDVDACMPHLYDPTLFSDPRCSVTNSTRRSLVLQHHRAYSEKDKPLPEIPRPSLVRKGVPDAPPPSPRSPLPPSISKTPPRSPLQSAFTPSSRATTAPSTPTPTPPSSPRLSSSPPRSPKAHTFPRGPQPSSVSSESKSSHGRPAAVQRHATFPSISSTLELLEERDSPNEKRCGVYVMDPQALMNGDDSAKSSMSAGRARSASASIGRSTGEAIKPALTGGSQSPKRKQRPTLPTLSTSTSSPQLRTLPVLASASSTPNRSPMSPTTFVASPTAKTPTAETPALPPSSIPFSSRRESCENDIPQPSSRWSLDSVASRPTPSTSRVTASPTSPSGAGSQGPSNGRRRDRLLSFITRGRSGSLGKAPALPPGPPTPAPAPAAEQEVLDISRRSESKEPQFEMVIPRPSLSLPLPPLPAPMSASASSSSSSSSSATSSASSLPTPAEPTGPSPPPKLMDPFSFTSESFMPGEADMARIPGERRSSTAQALLPPFQYQDMPYERPPSPTSPPPEPTLPLPSPGTPSPSFLVPQRPPSFFSSLALKRRVRRRGKKLVITGVSQGESEDNMTERDLERRSKESKRRHDNVVRWCESFGEIRKIERQEDGSLHVYWREWEVADMVCRVQAQVYIKEVGRVSLAWHYIS